MNLEDSADIWISKDRDEAETFLIEVPNLGESLRFGLRDVYPELSATTEQRLSALAERMLGSELSRLKDEAERVLRERGYP